jgi:5-methylcytosine-specific restriction endonuclease McrA
MKCHHKMAHGESIAGVKAECHWCGDSLRVLPETDRRAERHFCKNKDCRSEWLKTQTGENSPRWAGGKQSYTCPNCGETVKRKPANTHGENVFCDGDCYTSWKSRQMVGPAHFNWKGGYDQYYGKNWPAQRRKTLKRDNHTCQVCGHSPDESERGLDVHHIRPVRLFDTPEEANDLENLVSLCRSCHQRWEGIPLRPSTD